MRKRENLKIKHFEFYAALAATISATCFVISGVIAGELPISTTAYANVMDETPTTIVEVNATEEVEETSEIVLDVEIETGENPDPETVEQSISEFETVEQGEVEQPLEYDEIIREFNTYRVTKKNHYTVSVNVYNEPDYDSDVIGHVALDSVLVGYEYDDSFIEFEFENEFGYISLDSVEEYVVESEPVQEDMDTVNYFTLYTSIQSESGLTMEDIAYLLEGSYMEGYEYLYYNAEKVHGINAYFMLAVSQLESGWGRSDAGLYSNNLFGIMTGSGNIRYFNTKDECCEYWINLMLETYIGRGNDTPGEIGPVYCSLYWSEVICEYMNDLSAIVDRYRSA